MICDSCKKEYQPSEAELKLMKAKWNKAKATIEILAPLLGYADPFDALRKNRAIDAKQENE